MSGGRIRIIVLAAAAAPFGFLSKFVVIDFLSSGYLSSSSLSSSSSPSRSFSTYRYGIAILIVTMTLFFSLASVFSLSSLLWRLRRPPARRDVVRRRGSDPSSSSRPRAGRSDWDRRPGTVSRWRSPKSALVAPPLRGARKCSVFNRLSIEKYNRFSPLPNIRFRPSRAGVSRATLWRVFVVRLQPF